MPRHQVTFTVPDRPLARADVVFTVWTDDEKFGELRISKGNLVWYPRNKVYGLALSWAKLDELAREHERKW